MRILIYRYYLKWPNLYGFKEININKVGNNHLYLAATVYKICAQVIITDRKMKSSKTFLKLYKIVVE